MEIYSSHLTRKNHGGKIYAFKKCSNSENKANCFQFKQIFFIFDNPKLFFSFDFCSAN